MAAAIRNVGEIDPEHCRAHARRHFAQARMAAAYLARYHDLCRGAAAA